MPCLEIGSRLGVHGSQEPATTLGKGCISNSLALGGSAGGCSGPVWEGASQRAAKLPSVTVPGKRLLHSLGRPTELGSSSVCFSSLAATQQVQKLLCLSHVQVCCCFQESCSFPWGLIIFRVKRQKGRRQSLCHPRKQPKKTNTRSRGSQSSRWSWKSPMELHLQPNESS